MRSLEVAQHEAAHVVVGCALGLRVRRAVLVPARKGERVGAGWAEFDGRLGTIEAWGLMLAAGVAWELALHGARGWAEARGDVIELARMHVHTRPRVRALATAAGAMLASLAPVHARVTRALLERDLGPADVAALARGERPAA